MYSDEVVKRLRVLATTDDKEMAHIRADELLCQFLQQLGYSEIVKAFNDLDKWYA